MESVMRDIWTRYCENLFKYLKNKCFERFYQPYFSSAKLSQITRGGNWELPSQKEFFLLNFLQFSDICYWYPHSIHPNRRYWLEKNPLLPNEDLISKLFTLSSSTLRTCIQDICPLTIENTKEKTLTVMLILEFLHLF